MSGRPHPCAIVHLQARGGGVALWLFGLFSLILVGALAIHVIFSFALYLKPLYVIASVPCRLM